MQEHFQETCFRYLGMFMLIKGMNSKPVLILKLFTYYLTIQIGIFPFHLNTSGLKDLLSLFFLPKLLQCGPSYYHVEKPQNEQIILQSCTPKNMQQLLGVWF